MQSSLHLNPRFSLSTVCGILAVVVSLLVPLSAGAQASPAGAAVKQCRHRFGNRGKKATQAERRCIKNARSRHPSRPMSPTEAPSAAPTSAGPTVSSPVIGGDTVAPSAPSTPGPSVPATPPPLELEVPAAAVVVGSAAYRNPPYPLTSVTAIESTNGAEPGVTVQIEEEDLVVAASTEAAPALLHLVIGGTACTASECGRQVLIHLRLIVQPTTVPWVQVDPNGPTSGPAGFGPQVTVPSCSHLDYGFDEGPMSSGVGLSELKEAFDTHTPSSLPIGPHTIWFECLAGRGGPAVWRSEGFDITVTGASIPIGLESTTVPAGGELVFTSGPDLSAAPCPALAGIAVDELLINLNDANVSGEPLINHRNVPMPDGLATERLLVPTGSAAGTYSVLDRCIYGNDTGERAIFEFARLTGGISVTAG